MNQDVPWLYVAMIAIAFISWIFNRIQEATAERQRARELKRQRESARQEPASPPQRGPDAPPPLPTPREEPEDLLKDLFEALGGRPVAPVPSKRQERPPEKPVARKPPKAAKSSERVSLSAAERAALERVQAREAARLTPDTVPTVIRRGRSGKQLRQLLGSQSGLRQAVVLKEVLDSPVSLRDERRVG